jgi:hypothetical protein
VSRQIQFSVEPEGDFILDVFPPQADPSDDAWPLREITYSIPGKIAARELIIGPDELAAI